MKIALKDIKPNPFRRIKQYPINPEKVRVLRESIQTTGFWDNLLARKANGKMELAYGHHRLAALREEYPPSHQIDLPIRALSDEQMLKIMARDNMDEWGTSTQVILETVRAVVEAYGEGKIALGEVPETGRPWYRYAPSFLLEKGLKLQNNLSPYTNETLARFLGWVEPKGRPQQKLDNAVSALALIEEGVVPEKIFTGLSVSGMRAVVDEASYARAQKEKDRRAAENAAAKAEREAKALAKKAQSKNTTPKKRSAAETKIASLTQEAEEQRAAAQQAREFGKKQAKQHATHVSGALRKGATVEEARKESKKTRATAHVEKKQAKKEEKKRQERPREVAEYLEALASFTKVVKEAVAVARYKKFSPEAAKFVLRKHDQLRAQLGSMEEALK